MEKGFSIVTCHFSSQTVIYQWVKSDNRGDNRVTIRKIPGVLSLLGEQIITDIHQGMFMGKWRLKVKEETPKDTDNAKEIREAGRELVSCGETKGFIQGN